MSLKPICEKCGSELHYVASGFMRYNMKIDGTRGYMFMGQPDGKEEFFICSSVKCNTRFEVEQMGTGAIMRGKLIE